MEAMFGISWWIWAGLALVVALIYAFIHPQPNEAMAVWQLWLLRWGHTAVWLLLAASCVVRAVAPQATNIANGVAFLALPMYGLFLFTMMTGRN
jgi:hypothetical protein